MRTETIVIPEHTVTTTYYQFSELSSEARENVRKNYLDGQTAEMFRFLVLDDLRQNYTDSALDVEFSLGYCQGDGLNIYGELLLEDAYKFIKDRFTEKEQRFFSWVFREYRPEYKMKINGRYCFCIAFNYDFCENLTWDLENDNMKNVRWDLVAALEKALQEHFTEVCKRYEEDGYNYFYEVSDDDLENWADSFGYEFYEDGEIA